MFTKIVIGFIDLYRSFISPLTSPSCRFYPSCSSYTRQAVVKYGALKGVLMGVWRIMRCHPFHPGGYDPV
jgi:putative membrane protein insertion efficiency factor